MTAVPVYDYTASRNIDRYSIDKGMPERILMGMAALSSVSLLQKQYIESLSQKGSIHILCGPGNNGGDGLAFAYLLTGFRLTLPHSQFSDGKHTAKIHIYRTSESKSEAAKFYETMLLSTGLTIQPAENFLTVEAKRHDIIIEALLGTGQDRVLSGIFKTLYDKLIAIQENRNPPRIVSLDVPLGLTENKSSVPLVPDEIHSYGIHKTALYTEPEFFYQTEIHIPVMGFSPDIRNEDTGPEPDQKKDIRCYLNKLIEPKTITEKGHDYSLEKEESGSKNIGGFNGESSADLRDFFSRKMNDHKYSAGHGFLVGGSKGMEGAFLLAARSFFQAGGGILQGRVEDRKLVSEEPSILYEDQITGSFPCFAAGPGLRLSESSIHHMLEALNAETLKPEPTLKYIILDAGATSWIQRQEFPQTMRNSTIITPHQGEWKRIGGPEIQSVQGLYNAMAFNRQLQCFSLVKGPISYLLYPDGMTARIFPWPNRSLAVAGTGDILTGIMLASLTKIQNKWNHTECDTNIEQAVFASMMLLHKAAEKSSMASEISQNIGRFIRNEDISE